MSILSCSTIEMINIMRESKNIDYDKELKRISQIINNMTIKEFENMLFDCGLVTIKPSEESYYVKAVSR